MCLLELCCLYVQLDMGCLLIGATTFMISLMVSISSVVLLALGHEISDPSSQATAHRLLNLIHLNVNHESMNLIFGIILLISIIWMLSSVLLAVGVKRNNPSFVLTFFGYSTFIVFFEMLSSLLFVLHSTWVAGFVLAVTSLIYIHFLMVVHSYYELLLRGKVFGQQQLLDEEFLDDSVNITSNPPVADI